MTRVQQMPFVWNGGWEVSTSPAVRLLTSFAMVLFLIGCAGFRQFPERSENSGVDLAAHDPEYAKALADISITSDPEAKQAIRNRLVSERIRLIDLHFEEFERSLAQENVVAKFGTAAITVGLGAAGAVAGGGASQAMSAATAALTGTKEAYDKVALFDQAMPALLAQMIATREAILVRILSGMQQSITDYPLVLAVRDTCSYYLAGSIPGAIMATSSDASNKADRAAEELTSKFVADDPGKAIRAFWKPDGKTIDPEHEKTILAFFKRNKIEGESITFFTTSEQYAELRKKFVDIELKSGH